MQLDIMRQRIYHKFIRKHVRKYLLKNYIIDSTNSITYLCRITKLHIFLFMSATKLNISFLSSIPIMNPLITIQLKKKKKYF